MQHPLDSLAHLLHLDHAQYWHLRLLSSVAVVPLVLVFYLAYRFWTKRRES